MRRISGDVTLPELPKDIGNDRPVGLPSRYRIQEVIGEGGMGKVFRARDAILGRDVAIKVIQIGVQGTDGAKQRERFAREARAAARLAHPNIVGVHDVDPEAGWLVMDLVDGESLMKLGERGAARPALVRRIAEQVLGALDAAHAAGVIHRDVKPSNILVDATGKATLVDFGVARLVDAEMTRTGESVGTPAYMAPEQLRGASIDERTDLYGLGATLYELVTGQRMVAFESPSVAALAKLDAACGGDAALAAMISRCLQGAPEARPSSARGALELLATRRTKRWLPVAIAAGVVIAGAVGAVVAFRGTRDHDNRLQHAFATAQRGEHQKAQLELDDYLVTHPDDPDALTLGVLVHWWQHGTFPAKAYSFESKLGPTQRALVRGIDLMCQRQDSQAIAYLETVMLDHPDSVEIEFALGEARWHAGALDRSIATLEHAYEKDPRWQMALHHVIEYRLGRGEAAKLRPTANLLAKLDPPRAAALECQIAIAERHYDAAAGRALSALLLGEPIPDLYVCLSQAQLLAGQLERAEVTIRHMQDLWPIDLREWGGFAMQAELVLYRGRYAEFWDVLAGKGSRVRDIVMMVWDPEFHLRPDSKDPAIHPGAVTSTGAMRSPPIGFAMVLMAEHLRGKDRTDIYDQEAYPEVRAYGRALGAELKGDLVAATNEYRRALAVPAKGDMRMLAAYGLAKLLHKRGDAAGARDACREIIAPTIYYAYRAVLLPDCILWSNDPALWKWQADAWIGEWPHPAVLEIRKRLGE